MSDEDVLAYVQAAAKAMALPMDEARARAVALHFGRTVAIARALDAVPLAPDQEPAEIFRPAPFRAMEPRA